MNNEEKILELLGEIKSDISDMNDRIICVSITQENVVLPRLDLLAEGHKNLLDTLAQKSRVEELEDDVALLKSVVKSLSEQLAELKQAQ